MISNKQRLVDQLIPQRPHLSDFTDELSKHGVFVVQPGDVVSAVYYSDERRFFPDLDDEDRVVGGMFG